MSPYAKTGLIPRRPPLAGGTWDVFDDFGTGEWTGGDPWTRIRDGTHAGQLKIQVGAADHCYLNSGGSQNMLVFLTDANNRDITGWTGGAVHPVNTGGAVKTSVFQAGLWAQAKVLLSIQDSQFLLYMRDTDDTTILMFNYRGQYPASIHQILLSSLGNSDASLHIKFGYAQPASASAVADLVPFEVGFLVRRLIDATHAECECWLKCTWLAGCHPDGDDWLCVWKGTIDPTAVTGGAVYLYFRVIGATIDPAPSMRIANLGIGQGVFDPARTSRHRYLATSQGAGMCVSACAWVKDDSLAAGGRFLAAIRDGTIDGGTDGHVHLLAATDRDLAEWDEITVSGSPLFVEGAPAGRYYYNIQMGASGRTVLAVADKYGGAKGNLVGKVSEDGGLTWGAAFDIDASATYDCVACGRAVIRHSSGRWLVPYHDGSNNLLLAYTDSAVPNTGWHVVALGNPSGINEAALVERADGSLLLVARDPSSPVQRYAWFATCASPAGAGISTWSAFAQYDGLAGRAYVPNSIIPLFLVRGQLGRLHLLGGCAKGGFDLTGGAGNVGRMTIGRRFSDDGGATWRWAPDSPLFGLREIHVQYPWVARDGRRGFITWTTERLCAAIVDPAMFAEDGEVAW